MIGASFYIIVCTAKNRMRARLRRLREPRYLIGAIVGVAYFYFSFFARSRSSRASAARRAARGAGSMPPAVAALVNAGPAFAGLGLLALTVVAWIIPISSGLLDFSEAETQFLFPAPVSRRQLLIHRLVRSQLGLLFTSVIVAIATPSLAGRTRLRVSIATWLLLVIVKIYFTGITLARTKLLSADARSRLVAWAPLGVLATLVAIVTMALARAFVGVTETGAIDILTRMSDAVSHGAASVALWPFVAVARPLFAAWPGPYLSALAGATVVLAMTVLWVLQSDQTFQDATAQLAEQRSAASARKRPAYRVRPMAWTLAPIGRAEPAFAWKALVQTTRVVEWRIIARVVAFCIALAAAGMSIGRANGIAATVGVFVTAGAIFAILMAPQSVRIDIRQDLQHLELLKTWPVPPSAVVRGEMLWPGILITLFAWAFLAVAFLLSGVVFPRTTVDVRASTAIAVAVVAPALVFAQLAIHNGVALLFPAWVPTGRQRARGLDAMGQRLIMLTATMLALVVGALPGAIAGGIVWFAFRAFIGPAALVPGALVGSAVVLIEVLLGTEALGPLYERMDVLAVERAE